MFKNMLKGLVKNVCAGVIDKTIGDKMRQAEAEVNTQLAKEKSEQKEMNEHRPAATGSSAPEPNRVKQSNTVQEEKVCEMADAEAALQVPAEDGIREEFGILSEKNYSFLVPQEEHYSDQGDYHAGEIYQGYAYEKSKGGQSVSDMYFSIAAEFNCVIEESNAKKRYSRYHGTPMRSKLMQVEHPVFTHVYLFESASTYRLTYLKKIDECELLGCELVLKKGAADEALKAEIIREFKRFAGSCREA